MLNVLGCEKIDSVKLIPGKISLLAPFPPDSIKICANNEFKLEIKTVVVTNALSSKIIHREISKTEEISTNIKWWINID